MSITNISKKFIFQEHGKTLSQSYKTTWLFIFSTIKTIIFSQICSIYGKMSKRTKVDTFLHQIYKIANNSLKFQCLFSCLLKSVYSALMSFLDSSFSLYAFIVWKRAAKDCAKHYLSFFTPKMGLERHINDFQVNHSSSSYAE